MDEHTPVLVEEVFAAMAVRPAGLYVDATFGRGGHSARILRGLAAQGRVVAIDRDPAAIAAGELRFAHEPRLRLVHGEFSELATLLRAQGIDGQCDGIVFDFGVSSPQLDDAARGFSFAQDGPLDMRMDPTRGQPVSAWLARASSDEMRHVIATLGEERFAGGIAREIVRTRAAQPLSRTSTLASLVARVVRSREPGKHPATRTFQALRIWINDELGQIERGLAQALQLLAPQGRLAAISFHSLEDRLVKNFIRRHSEPDPALAALPHLPPQAQPLLRPVGRKQRASLDEIRANPRARSALLRVAEKIAAHTGPAGGASRLPRARGTST
ncbi:MAG TPA: 16S rRNA (cytosine(1402)-N(4))-methyltransferase RsmH [Steroidobacteraceae bacterium]